MCNAVTELPALVDSGVISTYIASPNLIPWSWRNVMVYMNKDITAQWLAVMRKFSTETSESVALMRYPASTSSWLPLVACCLSTFLLLLYTTIVTVPLPVIGMDLNAGFGERQWIIDVYTVALAGLLLGAGALSDMFGEHRIYVMGLAIFGAATVACGIAPSPAWLIGARAAQGFGGAAAFAAILPLIGRSYGDPRQKAKAFAIWGAVSGAASAIGTVGGGMLAEYVGWRWIFIGTLPLCVIALVLSMRAFPVGDEVGHHNERFDWSGSIAITACVTSLVYAVIVTGESGWEAGRAAVGWFVAVVAGGVFLVAEYRSAQPILPLGLFGAPGLVGVMLTAFGYYFAAFGSLPVLATWMQAQLGLGSLATSLVIVCQVLVFIAVSGFGSHRLHAIHPGWRLGGGTILIGVAALSVLALEAVADWRLLLPFPLLSGLGAGVVSPALPAVAMAAAPVRYAGTASAAANASRQLGLAVGIAACASVAHTGTLASVTAAHLVSGVIGIGTGVAGAALLWRANGSEHK